MAFGNRLNSSFRNFIERQHMFFVATAGIDGTVNLSPKGLDSLRVLDDRRIVWLNLSGSGNETAAHLRSVNRMTLMFCSFEDDALILRLYGAAKTLHPRDDGWGELVGLFPEMAGSRQVFDMAIDRVQTSCGTGVPLMRFEAQRGPDELLPFYEDMGPQGVTAYWARKNAVSIDGQVTGTVETDQS